MVNAPLDTSALREAMFPRPAHEDLLQIPREIKMCLIVNRAVQDIIAIQMPSLLKRGNVTLVMFASWVSHFYRINTVCRTLRHFIYAKILFLRHTISEVVMQHWLERAFSHTEVSCFSQRFIFDKTNPPMRFFWHFRLYEPTTHAPGARGKDLPQGTLLSERNTPWRSLSKRRIWARRRSDSMLEVSSWVYLS